jgi:hypothetical protein
MRGKKISLFRGASGDSGFSVFSNEFRIHSDYNGTDITFSFDNLTNGFSERFRVRANGNATYSDVLTQNSSARLKKGNYATYQYIGSPPTVKRLLLPLERRIQPRRTDWPAGTGNIKSISAIGKRK